MINTIKALQIVFFLCVGAALGHYQQSAVEHYKTVAASERQATISLLKDMSPAALSEQRI